MKHDRVTVRPSRLRGSITAPPSKSMAHRHLVCASFAEGTSTIDNIDLSEDIRATIACCESLGARIDISDGKAVVQGAGLPAENAGVTRRFDCNESGSTLRFMIPPALLLGSSAVFTGSRTLLSRPLSVYEDLFERTGMVFDRTETEITVYGTLKPGTFEIPGDISSQFVSGLLFALPLLDGDSRIVITGAIESRPYIDMTLCALSQAGIEARWESDSEIIVPGTQKYRPFDVRVEGDWSNAAFFLAMDTFGSGIEVDGLDSDSLQGDRECTAFFHALMDGFAAIDISACPDLGPVLFAVAAGHHGGRFTGTDRLKIKESDRGEAMCAELEKFGISTQAGDDCITVFGGDLQKPVLALEGHNDHRIVMALTVLLLQTGGTIDGACAVNKSFPDFFGRLAQLGAELEFEGIPSGEGD